MKAEHLDEAKKVVESIAFIDRQLAYPLAKSTQQLTVLQAPNSSTYITLYPDVAAAALEMQRSRMRSRRAELVRRANQIGLIL